MPGMRRAGFVLGLVVFLLMPVAAGAAGHSGLAMLAFAGMFLLGNAVVRPASVDLSSPGAVAAQVLTASAFAALLVSLGQTLRALGQIEGEMALFPFVFVAAWAMVLMRLVWPPGFTDRVARTAERGLKVVHDAGQPRPVRRKPAAKRADRGPRPVPPVETVPSAETVPPAERAGREAPVPMAAPPVPEPPSDGPTDPALTAALARLDALPETGTSEADLAAALETLSGAAPLPRVFAALRMRTGTERDRRALVRHATDPWVAEQRIGAKEPAAAFEAVVAAADAVALRDFAVQALALLDGMPQIRGDMPAVARLLEIADQIEGTLEEEAELLVALAHRLEDLDLEAENGADA